MDHLNIDKFAIYAASGGGIIALRVAIQYPERVQCLSLLCPTTGGYVHPEMAVFTPFFKKFATSPTLMRMITNSVKKDPKGMVSSELMTANKIKPNILDQKEADRRGAEIANDPYFSGLISDTSEFMKF